MGPVKAFRFDSESTHSSAELWGALSGKLPYMMVPFIPQDDIIGDDPRGPWLEKETQKAKT